MLCLAALALCLAGCREDVPANPPRYTDTPLSGAKPVYNIAFLPLHNPHKSHAMFDPLVRHLQRSIPDVQFEFEAAKDFPAFEDKLRQRTVAFALPNPYEALLALKHGYRVVAKVASDDDFRGIFVVRRDSPISQVSDLKGKVVAYPATSALAAALQAQYFLHRHGIDVERDLDNRYVGSQDSSILAVYYRQAAAGATWPPTWRVFQRSRPDEAAQLQVLWRTESLPNLPLVARDDVPAELVAKVRETLFALPERPPGRAILAGMEFAGFEPADDATYAPVRRFVRDFSARVRPIDIHD